MKDYNKSASEIIDNVEAYQLSKDETTLIEALTDILIEDTYGYIRVMNRFLGIEGGETFSQYADGELLDGLNVALMQCTVDKIQAYKVGREVNYVIKIKI